MSTNSSWQPMEDGTTIFSERTWLTGMVLTAMAYGVVFTLFILTIKQLVRTVTKDNYTQRLIFIIYTILMLILGTLYVGSIAKMTELGFIDYRLFPGGPAAFEQLKFSLPSGTLSNVSFIIANWLADAMMIYRYLVIYRSTRQFPLWVVMLIPILMYMTSFSLGVVWLIQVSAPDSSPWTVPDGAINFTTPYCWVTLSLNVLLTMAISTRLFFHKRRAGRILGPNHGSQYTSVAAILVESSSLYTVFTLLFFIPFAINNPIQNVFVRPLGEVQIIASLLIVYRVAYGASWVNETSHIIFASKETQSSQGVQVQVEISGPQERLANHLSKSVRGQGERYEMQKSTV